MEQRSGDTDLPKTLSKNEANQVEQKNKTNKDNEKAEHGLKQEKSEQHSSKGTLEGSQVQKCSVSFEATQNNGSLESSRERSGSGGSSISSNGSSNGSSHKSSGNSNGSSKKVVVVRSAPITIGKVRIISWPSHSCFFQIEKKRADSPRSPPVVPPIPEDEEEELSDFVGAR